MSLGRLFFPSDGKSIYSRSAKLREMRAAWALAAMLVCCLSPGAWQQHVDHGLQERCGRVGWNAVAVLLTSPCNAAAGRVLGDE